MLTEVVQRGWNGVHDPELSGSRVEGDDVIAVRRQRASEGEGASVIGGRAVDRFERPVSRL